jgi:predicted ATPase/class 3 adenylate cyclase
MAELPSGTVTFLFTDIEGSTRLWEQHPEAMRQALARHDVLLRHAIERCSGCVFKTVGDQFCAAFATAPDALSAACDAQRSLQAEAWGATGRLQVRMALHTGAAESRGGDYFGAALSRVARLLAVGHGGQTLLSQATCNLVRDVLPRGATLCDMGAHRLKDWHQSEHIFQLLLPDLPAIFPPLRSAPDFAHNLPARLTRFIGRDREMAELKRLLTSSRLVTLTGAGGCGKTRLALQVAGDLLADNADGVWLVELAPLADPALVPQAVGAVLGVREVPGRPLDQTLCEYLRSRQLLLVLDNCEHLITACAHLAEALVHACPDLRILATTREALGITGETPYNIPPLSLPNARQQPDREGLLQSDAVRLFVDRAATALPTFTVTDQNASAVAQVCYRLDGIPLALELAAGRVKVLPVEQIAARLDDRFRLLTSGSRTALPRQQTLRALIDWSYDLLPDEERALLQRLSVFAGGWTLEAAEAVCAGGGVEEWQVLDLLSRLVEKSLVVVDEDAAGQGRYRLLETVKQYSQDRLEETAEAEAVRSRHRDWYLALAEQAESQLRGPAQDVWLNRLEAEHANLRAALSWCAEEEGAESRLRLAGALWWFWDVRGYLTEGREHLVQLLSQQGGANRTAARARVLFGAGMLAGRQGDYGAACSSFAESVAIFREVQDRRGLSLAVSVLGIMQYEQGDRVAARAMQEESVALARESGDQWSLAWALLNMGEIARCEGDYPAAATLNEECLALFRALGDTQWIVMSLSNLGCVVQRQGDDRRSAALFAESLALGRELDLRNGVTASCLAGLAAAATAEHPERAARLLGSADALLEATGTCMEPADRPDYEQFSARVRAALDEAAFAAAWAQGRALPLEQAIAEALEEATPG